MSERVGVQGCTGEERGERPSAGSSVVVRKGGDVPACTREDACEKSSRLVVYSWLVVDM
jgi:hypothetical protein